jgi:hypothetical protein
MAESTNNIEELIKHQRNLDETTIFPFWTALPDNLIGFQSCELLPGVTLRKLLNHDDLEEYQGMWENFKKTPMGGIMKTWLEPNMMLVVEGKNYLKGFLCRAKEKFGDKVLDNYSEIHTSDYLAFRQVLCCLFLLKPCHLEFCDNHFVINYDKDGNVIGGSYGPMLPSKNITTTAVSVYYDDTNYTKNQIKKEYLISMFSRMEMYYSPIFLHERISVALGCFWSFISTSSLESAYLSLVTVLEALISTGKTEISYQLAERIAVLLGDNLGERKEFFYKIKRIYADRSKFIHGNSEIKKGPLTWNQPFVSAKRVSVNINTFRDLMRITIASLVKIISDDNYISVVQNKKDADLDEYFLNKLFS